MRLISHDKTETIKKIEEFERKTKGTCLIRPDYVCLPVMLAVLSANDSLSAISSAMQTTLAETVVYIDSDRISNDDIAIQIKVFVNYKFRK